MGPVMRFLKKLILGLLLVVAAMAAISFVLPRDVAVSRSIAINAPPEAVFPYINDLKKFSEWSPWSKIDPNAKFEYTGPASGVGQKVSWASSDREVGTGSQEIIESVDNQMIRTALDFGADGKANATLHLKPAGNGTEVTWGFSFDTGYNPISRWMGLMFDNWVGTQYEKGLVDLKKLVESQ